MQTNIYCANSVCISLTKKIVINADVLSVIMIWTELFKNIKLCRMNMFERSLVERLWKSKIGEKESKRQRYRHR